jgi:hypothetical protein
MRIIEERSIGDVKVSIFSWNNKYIIKYELGPFEQTYKVHESNIVEEASLNSFFEEEFLTFVREKFKEMGYFFLNHLEKI